MPKPDIEKRQMTRSKGGYIPFQYQNKIFNTSFFPNTLKLWNNLPQQTRVLDMQDFKTSIKTLLKPKRHKHFNCGSKIGNKWLTQIRVGKSDLMFHKFFLKVQNASTISNLNDLNIIFFSVSFTRQSVRYFLT